MIEPRKAVFVVDNNDRDDFSALNDVNDHINLDLHRETNSSSCQRLSNIETHDDDMIIDGQETENSDHEPLGYQHFLCNVNIEYSPGGNRGCSESNRHSFKLKYLPYMIPRDYQENQLFRSSVASSNSSICDPQQPATIQDDKSIINSDPKHIDVTKATCAFLGNSDYVPNKKFKRSRVVLELISAKLSQSTTFNVPVNSSYTNLVTLAEQSPLDATSSTNNGSNVYERSTPKTHANTPVGISRDSSNNNLNTSSKLPGKISPSTPPPTLTPSTSKRFVNYTLLIKTAPGLDNHPAVIERRFSDFLLLYQGLKSYDSFGKIVDKHVTFPKKVYMGNFSLTNIAERSIEFTRLLNLCMTRTNLLWSIPFISFLLDKELKEAHRLSLCGHPDDVQALIETAYFIQQKLYLGIMQSLDSSNFSISLETTDGPIDRYSPILPNGKPVNLNPVSSSNETISAESDYSTNHHQNHQFNRPTSTDPGCSSSPVQSVGGDISEGSGSSFLQDKRSLCALNQRILVTFCMLFLTYHNCENYADLKVAVKLFIQLISPQEYLDSIIGTRHYQSLKACLLFLMNLNHGNVIDEDQRLLLKRKLESADGAYADLSDSSSIFNQSYVSSSGVSSSPKMQNVPRNRKRNGNNNDSINDNSSVHRTTKGDLIALLRDRNFCSFQDGKFGTGC